MSRRDPNDSRSRVSVPWVGAVTENQGQPE